MATYDPILSTTRTINSGDINTGRGMFGLASATVSTLLTPTINHTPGAQFSGYYNRYVVNILQDSDFILADIGTPGGVIIGHTLCIDAVVNNGNTSVLRIRNSSLTQIAEIESGHKVFLIAIAPNVWKVAYCVPEGRNNWLIVYTGPYPKVRLLPIKKEFDYNGNFEYGIKSIESYDFTEPANLVNVVNYTNPNKIIFEGSTNTSSPLAGLAFDAIHSTVACENTFYIPNGGSVSAMLACHNSSSFEQLQNSKGIFMAGSELSLIDNSTGTSPLFNASVICSRQGYINGNNGGTLIIAGVEACDDFRIENIPPTDATRSVFGNSSTTSRIASSINSAVSSSLGGEIESSLQSGVNSCSVCIIRGSVGSKISTSTTSAITDSIISAIQATDASSFTGDATNTFNIATGYANRSAGINILSTHNLALDTTVNDYRYCVVGGFNAPTWSIDSKTGTHYALNTFVSGQALPGFAEMYENVTKVEIPVGRLLVLDGGKVRLAKNGETGYLISRPFETSAFVAGNPQDYWNKKYVTDVFGRVQIKNYNKSEYLQIMKDEGRSKKELEALDISDGPISLPEINKDYDPSRKYTQRKDRIAEWTTCERSGIVVIEFTGELAVNDHVISSGNGIGKKSLRKTNIKVLEIVDATHAKIDISGYNSHDYISLIKDVKVGVFTLEECEIEKIVVTDTTVELLDKRKIKISVKFIGDNTFADNMELSINGVPFEITVARFNGKKMITCELISELEAGIYTLNLTNPSGFESVFSSYLKIY
jgi:hypothetical protein